MSTDNRPREPASYIESTARISMSYSIVWRQGLPMKGQALAVGFLGSLSYASLIAAAVSATKGALMLFISAVALFAITALTNWYFTNGLLIRPAWELDSEAMRRAAADPINSTTVAVQGAIWAIAILLVTLAAAGVPFN